MLETLPNALFEFQSIGDTAKQTYKARKLGIPLFDFRKEGGAWAPHFHVDRPIRLVPRFEEVPMIVCHETSLVTVERVNA